MTKILTETISVLNVYLGENPKAQAEVESSNNKLKMLLNSGYRIKHATSTTLRDMIFVTYVLEKEEE